MRRWWQRPSSLFFGALFLTVGTMVGRAACESSAELSRAEAARQSDQVLRSIEHYRRALRWSFPFSPHTPEAISGLEACAAESEDSGDVSAALLAWRSLLGGLSATRVPYLPPSSAEARAKAEIPRLEVLQSEASVRSGAALERQMAEYRRQLDVRVAPQPLWGTLLLLGFATWLVSLESLARRGFDEEGRFRWTAARMPLWSALGGWFAFMVGLAFA